MAVGVGLFALAFGAFTHLSGRIDSTATELRTEVKEVNVKLDKLSVDLNAKVEKLDTKLSGRMDSLDAKNG